MADLKDLLGGDLTKRERISTTALSDVARAVEQIRSATALSDIARTVKQFPSANALSDATQAIERFRLHSATALSDAALVAEGFRSALSGAVQTIERFRSATALSDAAQAIERFRLSSATALSEVAQTAERVRLAWPDAFNRAALTATHASTLALPNVLEAYRTPDDIFPFKLLQTQSRPWWDESKHLAAFGSTSAFADLLAASSRVGSELQSATKALTGVAIPALANLAQYRGFLDAAGLTLPRWPRVRPLTTAERRQRFKLRLHENAEPLQVRRAKSLVHQYELVLREIIDVAMCAAFGEDWAERRLPVCECNDLLAKWRKRGGDVLSHANYYHYAQIMSHPEHFEAVFAAGFVDRDGLHSLMVTAGRLRAASHHAHQFTLEDLRDLRMTWRVIETGLIALMPGHTVEF